MRAVVQRVIQAKVTVQDELISSIGRGLCIFVGISRDDTDKDIDYLVNKILKLRIWNDAEGKRWKTNVVDNNYEILCVSQFTLYNVLKGNSPDFHQAMTASLSKDFFDKFMGKLRSSYQLGVIKEGKFGAKMAVDLTGDGPVTIQLESPKPTLS